MYSFNESLVHHIKKILQWKNSCYWSFSASQTKCSNLDFRSMEGYLFFFFEMAFLLNVLIKEINGQKYMRIILRAKRAFTNKSTNELNITNETMSKQYKTKNKANLKIFQEEAQKQLKIAVYKHQNVWEENTKGEQTTMLLQVEDC